MTNPGPYSGMPNTRLCRCPQKLLGSLGGLRWLDRGGRGGHLGLQRINRGRHLHLRNNWFGNKGASIQSYSRDVHHRPAQPPPNLAPEHPPDNGTNNGPDHGDWDSYRADLSTCDETRDCPNDSSRITRPRHRIRRHHEYFSRSSSIVIMS